MVHSQNLVSGLIKLCNLSTVFFFFFFFFFLLSGIPLKILFDANFMCVYLFVCLG